MSLPVKKSNVILTSFYIKVYEVYTGYVWDMYGTSGGVLVDGWWLLVVGFQWAVAVGSRSRQWIRHCIL